jgi:Flp pilus assembly protein TadB
MAGKEIDRDRARGATAVLRQHPGMVLFVASPAIVAVGLVWWLAGPVWGVLLLVALVLAGGAAAYSLVSKRR